jgi:hypothetical protein
MTIEEFKERCLENIAKETQLEKAEHLAENRPLEIYHRGRKQVWLEVHETLVRRL